MFSFKRLRQPSYLGVDLGSTSIKIVELKNQAGIPRLVTYGHATLETLITEKEEEGQEEKIASLIKEIIKRARMTSRLAISALPSFAVFSSVINLPEMDKKDLETAVYNEAKKIIPLPLKEVILDWKILTDETQKVALSKKGFRDKETPILPTENQNIENKPFKTNFKILLTATQKKLVDRYIKIFQLANLDLLSLETESFALSRALVANDPSVIMIIDLGAHTSDIVIVEKGIPILSRSIDIGGETITSAIVTSTHATREAAEQIKMDLREMANNQIPLPVKNVLDQIISEIQYSLKIYNEQNQKKVEKVILSGGSSFVVNLPEYLSKTLDFPVYIGNPWSRVIYPTELKPILDELAPRFALAVGLAIREID